MANPGGNTDRLLSAMFTCSLSRVCVNHAWTVDFCGVLQLSPAVSSCLCPDVRRCTLSTSLGSSSGEGNCPRAPGWLAGGMGLWVPKPVFPSLVEESGQADQDLGHLQHSPASSDAEVGDTCPVPAADQDNPSPWWWEVPTSDASAHWLLQRWPWRSGLLCRTQFPTPSPLEHLLG